MESTKVSQLVEIWRHRKTHTYKIQPWAKLTPTGGGWGIIGGPTVVIDEDEFETRIATVLLEELDRSSNLVYDATQAPKSSAKESAEFARAHSGVSVSRLSDGQVKVAPLERCRGGHRSVDEAICRLRPEEVTTRLKDVIRDAFSHAE